MSPPSYGLRYSCGFCVYVHTYVIISFITSRNPREKNTEVRGIMDSRVELKKILIYQRQIPGQHWGAGKPPSKIIEKGMTVDIDGEES